MNINCNSSACETNNVQGVSERERVQGISGSNLAPDRLRQECIIALKVYDFCRQQDCLESDSIGPARVLKTTKIGCLEFEEGAVIEPPESAVSVSIDNLKVCRAAVTSKEPNPFRNGFWDVTIKYIFTYKLTFREVDNTIVAVVPATNVFTKKVTLFGSIESDVKLSTDLFCSNFTGDDNELDSGPFILVESKAVALNAEIIYRTCCTQGNSVTRPSQVHVTIGLFTIIKLFRIANLTVESRGFCIPDECEDISAITPCEYFENLDFPMDIFAPPQRAEFVAGISSNIPHRASNSQCSENKCGCGCGCGCSES